MFYEYIFSFKKIVNFFFDFKVFENISKEILFTEFIILYNIIMSNSTSLEKPFILTNITQKFNDLENEKKRKIRELKDVSTKCFVNIFFDSTEILFKFIYWVYHKINCSLIDIPCQDDEKIIFFFKGGNIMFLWRKIFEKMHGSADKDIIGKTSISDCDFAIYILTKDERRYNEIYSQVKNVLIRELEEIGAKFDELYKASISKNKNENRTNAVNQINIGNMNNLDMNQLKNFCVSFKSNEEKLFNDYFKNFYTRNKIQRLLTEVIDELKKLHGIEFYEEKNYEIYKYNIPDYFIINIRERKSIVLRPENEVPNPFSLTNFLTDKVHYVTVNANIFNDLSKAGHLIGFDLYRIKFNTIINPILKSKKINQNKNNNRFEPLNSQENFGIPSEFIDISVSKYYDLNLKKLREYFYNSQNNQNKNNFLKNKFALIGCRFQNGFSLDTSILTMQMNYIIEDLLVTLFSQNQHNPMIDPKYDKRLFRIFFFYIGNNLRENKNVIQYNIFDYIVDPIFIEYFNSNSVFYNYFLEPNDNLDINYIKNMKGKSIGNFFNIKNEFNELRYLLQFTILFNKILDNNEILSDFIKYYNNIYNIIDNSDITDFKKKFNNFKKDLTDNYKKAYEYFIKVTRTTRLSGGLGKNNDSSNNSSNSSNRSGQETPKKARSITSLSEVLNQELNFSYSEVQPKLNRSITSQLNFQIPEVQININKVTNVVLELLKKNYGEYIKEDEKKLILYNNIHKNHSSKEILIYDSKINKFILISKNLHFIFQDFMNNSVNKKSEKYIIFKADNNYLIITDKELYLVFKEKRGKRNVEIHYVLEKIDDKIRFTDTIFNTINSLVTNYNLYNIGDGVTLDYKEVNIPIKNNKREFYPSFQLDDDNM